jgi:amidohydrolase
MDNTSIPINELKRFRRELHKFPELSGQEMATAKRVVNFLKPFKPDQLIENIGGTGVAAIYDAGNEGPVVLIRCELDALPIAEINDFEYRSVYPGLGHKCGHDGHMAIVCGLATQLAQTRPQKGRVVLLFQPAEEDGRGAAAVLADQQFEAIRPDYVFALHNLPGYPLHEVVCRPESFTAAVRSMIVQFKGKTAHAGEPEMGINPALAIAEFMQKSLSLQRPPEKDDFALVTPIQIEMGEEAYGISAGEGEVKLTLRTWNNVNLDDLSNRLQNIAKEAAQQHGLGLDIKWTQEFAANQNAAKMVELVEQVAKQHQLNYQNKATPFKWGEDFGLFTKRFPGAMFGIGGGEGLPALHNPDYDFPDELIPTGVNLFHGIIQQLLK